MKPRFVLWLLCLCFGTVVHNVSGAVTAASVSLADVQAAVTACPAGDTVILPSGSAAWTGGVTLSKAITIQGAGSSNTSLSRAGAYSGSFFQISGLPADVPVRITGINFESPVGQSGWKYSIYVLNTFGNSFGYTKIRIDNCRFHGGQGVVYWKNWAYGIVDHCVFLNGVYIGCMYADGDYDWMRAGTPSYGTAEAVFWEDNTFREDGNLTYFDCLFDHDFGGRSVFRYNTFDLNDYTSASMFGSLITHHGNQALWKGDPNTDNTRGTVISEIYHNTFNIREAYRVIYPRGGRNIIANNTFTSKIGNLGAVVAFAEEECQNGFISGVYRTVWPAEDQVNNTFIFGNTLNGGPLPPGAIYNWNSAANVCVQVNRDYWLQAPDASTKTTYPQPGAPSKSNYPLPYNPPVTAWNPYTYPHPLVAGGPMPTPSPSPTPAPPVNIADGSTINVGYGTTAINVTLAGTYVLNGSVQAPDAGANSMWIDFDSNPQGDDNRSWPLAVSTSWTNQAVTWRGNATGTQPPEFSPKRWTLNAGIHTLYIAEREKGTLIRSVGFALAGTPTPTPSATPAPTPTPTPQPTATPSPTPENYSDWLNELSKWIQAHPALPNHP